MDSIELLKKKIRDLPGPSPRPGRVTRGKLNSASSNVLGSQTSPLPAHQPNKLPTGPSRKGADKGKGSVSSPAHSSSHGPGPPTMSAQIPTQPVTPHVREMEIDPSAPQERSHAGENAAVLHGVVVTTSGEVPMGPA